jgi:hypothetical protein
MTCSSDLCCQLLIYHQISSQVLSPIVRLRRKLELDTMFLQDVLRAQSLVDVVQAERLLVGLILILVLNMTIWIPLPNSSRSCEIYVQAQLTGS